MPVMMDPATFDRRWTPSPAEFLALNAGWVQAPDLTAVATLRAHKKSWDDVVPQRYWKYDAGVNAVTEKSKAEKDARGTLEQTKAELKAALFKALNAYFEGRGYTFEVETRLTGWSVQASRKLKVNRQAYCQAWMDWQESVLSEYSTRWQALDAATSDAAAVAVSQDFSSFDAADPAATVEGALEIAD